MKKIIYTLLLFSFSLSYSQTKITPDEHWSAYAISVQPQNEETVFNIIDEYFSENIFKPLKMKDTVDFPHDERPPDNFAPSCATSTQMATFFQNSSSFL